MHFRNSKLGPSYFKYYKLLGLTVKFLTRLLNHFLDYKQTEINKAFLLHEMIQLKDWALVTIIVAKPLRRLIKLVGKQRVKTVSRTLLEFRNTQSLRRSRGGVNKITKLLVI